VIREVSRTSLAAAAEATVTALAIGGDNAAYGELVRRRQAQIRGLFRHLCRDAALADDLAQQTFFQAWRRMGTLRVPAAFGGWLRKIAISIWLQHIRAHARESSKVLPAQEWGVDAEPATAGGLPGSEETLGAREPEHGSAHVPTHVPAQGPLYGSAHEPAHEATIGEQLDLDRALAELPLPVRLCVVLAYSEGLSHREISGATRIPLGTVKSHISRGAARLRDLLRAYA
jgi:RNA polymerase sigma-70 factor, ECF subfamily